jgi:GntR family transcriptional regulator/MocR family aminotransferase
MAREKAGAQESKSSRAAISGAVPEPGVWVMDDMVAAKEAAGATGSSLDELTLAEFITSGGYDRQIRLTRLAYRRRRDRLVAVLREQAPQVRVTGIAAGLHALAELPAGEREDEITARAAARGLSVDGLASYRAAAGDRGPALVVGYGRPPGHAFTTALARLCAALAPPGR